MLDYFALFLLFFTALTLFYGIIAITALCIVIFKVFKIPLNKWTVPTAVLGGKFLIGGLIFTMNYNHPYSESTRAGCD